MRTGVRLGIDVGRARVGVARSDPHGMLATPVETLARREAPVASADGADVALALNGAANRVAVDVAAWVAGGA